MIAINPRDMKTRDVYSLLTRAVAPRPIAFVSTLSKNGIGNLAPFSYFNAGGANPPSVVFSPLTTPELKEKDTLRNIRETKEYVINIVSYGMREKMNLASAPFPYEVDEFDMAQFTRLPSMMVKPPRVAESHIHLECKLFTIVSHGEGPFRANYVIGEVVYFHVSQEVWRNGTIEPALVDVIGRMGGAWYCRAAPENMFELERPKI